MKLVDLIRRKRSTDLATAIHAISATTQSQLGQSVRSVTKVARIAIANQGTVKVDPHTFEVKSRWWLVKFINRDPKEICFTPIATVEQVLKAITGAISAEPLATGSPGLINPDHFGHWSESEIELVTLRTVSFVSRGVPTNDAEVLACHLVERDRTFDDRRSCAECWHLRRGLCLLDRQPFGGGGVEVLHRCSAFKEP